MPNTDSGPDAIKPAPVTTEPLAKYLKMIKKIVTIVAVVIAIPLLILGWDRYQDRQIKVTVNAATPLYSSDVDAAYGSLRPVRNLKPGEKLKVIRATYGKDYGALLVKAEGGGSGWIAFGQDGLTIHQRK